MPLFDNAVRQAVPGGNVAKPLLIALGALLATKLLSQGGGTQAASVPGSAGPAAGTPGLAPGSAGPTDSKILDGLGQLVDKFQKGGLGEVIGSWVGPGQNKPIQPGQLGSVLGEQTVSSMAQQAGINQDELLAQLSKVLPGIVDKLTPKGRLPTLLDISGDSPKGSA